MIKLPALYLPDNPKLAHNITHFARALRKAGLPIGPGRVIDAVRAVQAAGFTDRTDFFWTLHACFVSKPEKRAAEALLDGRDLPVPEEAGDEVEIEIDASRTISTEERLRTLDFEQMSAAEMAQATRMLAQLRLPVPPILSRRTQMLPGQLPDWHGTMRSAMRRGGEVTDFATKRRRIRYPNLVVICDI